MKTRLFLLAAGVAALLWTPLLRIFAGSPAPTKGEPILIGTIQPMTGPYAAFGVKFYQAYNLAADEINAAGGIKGRPIDCFRRQPRRPPIKATILGFSTNLRAAVWARSSLSFAAGDYHR